MKVVIVAPSGIPYEVGGAEKLWWGLLDGLRRYTGHEVELLKIPSPERNFAEVVQSYRRFSELDLAHFDLVISTKYPAWMVRHHNHYVYLQHTLRRLYDTYPADLPTQLGDWPPELEALRQSLALTPASAHRARLFAALSALLDPASVTPDPRLSLPSPLARQVIHWLDRSALRAGNVNKFMAISANVASRADYFPPGVPVQVIHHPSDLEPAAGAPGAYIFTVSRLHKHKRLDLLIRAMGCVEEDIPLLIAGTGPDEARLKCLARGDSRIRFSGRVADARLRQLYAGALAVAFVPADEDYGLVTVEALQAGKPVISCLDSGGVAELIEPERTGWLCAPEPAALGRCIARLARDPALASAMAGACLDRGGTINWERTTAAVLDGAGLLDNDGLPRRGRPAKIVVAVSFPVYPARTGGASRIYHLYRHIARLTPVTLVTLCPHDDPARQRQIAPGLTEIRIPRSAGHARGERALAEQLGVPAGDVYALDHMAQTPAYLHALKGACLDADLAIASHPYMYPAIRAVYRGPVYYDAHHVEADMKSALFGGRGPARRWLQRVREVEGECCRDSIGVAACSEPDRARLCALYGPGEQALTVVHNGTNVPTVSAKTGRVPTVSAKTGRPAAIRGRVRPAGPVSALFMGSRHGPNVRAATWIVEELAPARPELEFWLAGNLCAALAPARLPGNVRLCGQVDEREKWVLLRAADLALNPVAAGAGNNLKMTEYAAAGLPIISTPQGCRGLALALARHVHVAELSDFVKKLEEVVNRLGSDALRQMSAEARAVVVASHDWRGIAKSFYGHIVTVCGNAR